MMASSLTIVRYHGCVPLQFEHDNLRITLIDTPGFNDTLRSETEILRDVADWLDITYRNPPKSSSRESSICKPLPTAGSMAQPSGILRCFDNYVAMNLSRMLCSLRRAGACLRKLESLTRPPPTKTNFGQTATSSSR